MAYIRVKFYLEKRKDKSGQLITKNVPILFSASFGDRFKSTTGICINADQWNGKDSVKSHPKSEVFNKQLRNIRLELEKLYDTAIKEDIPVSVEYFKQGLRRNQRSANGFFDLMDDFIEQGKKKWQPGTVTKFKTIKNHLKDFGEKKRIKVEFDQLDNNFFDKLIDFYFEDNKFINSYVRKNIMFIKQFLIWSTKRGYNKKLDFREWNLETGTKREDTDGNIIALSIPELLHIYEMKIKNQTVLRIRDYLILACSTGLRYSDIANLKKTDVDHKQGFIYCTTIKTGDRTMIPFNDFSREILEKYKNTPNYNKDGVEMAFPAISNQKTNKQLKELAKEAGLTEMVPIVHYRRNRRIDKVVPKYKLISSHIGRKTFITFCVWLGVPSEVTMKFTTHRKHETMQKYYDSKDESALRQEMRKFSMNNLREYTQNSAN
ncbi:MAG: tyrosine-type recombinase/integrase [Bacteroidetes bacterium]|nr:tyrosine-type recombinase/integrase [Bacteroidota bacterium]MBL6964261.1 tyrosine-type recombinase/integrase [Bacteroidota bacterium]